MSQYNTRYIREVALIKKGSLSDELVVVWASLSGAVLFYERILGGSCCNGCRHCSELQWQIVARQLDH